ncbi:unnamed protein product [Durusdinium trenchii]|uniref:FACT complex subunit SSRP1 n=1 Tax=Durusdinium trenchii TaxID=1381693 RepID=A0ABP0JJ75_9DINO
MRAASCGAPAIPTLQLLVQAKADVRKRHENGSTALEMGDQTSARALRAARDARSRAEEAAAAAATAAGARGAAKPKARPKSSAALLALQNVLSKAVQSGQHKAALSKNSVVDLVQMAHINTHTGRKRPLRWLGEEALMEQVELPNAIGGKVAVPSRYQVFVEGSGWKTMSVKGSASLEDSLRWQGGGTHVFEEHGCKYRVNLEERTLTNLTTGQTASVRPLEEWYASAAAGLKTETHLPRRLPGAMGHEVSQACIRRGMTLAPVGLTGPSMPAQCQVQEGALTLDVKLVGPEAPGAQKQALEDGAGELKKQHGDRLVIIDFTHPTAAGVNFVFGTTGGDREKLMKVTADSGVYAVIVPQMKLLRARRFGSDGSGRGGCYREFPNEEGRDTEAPNMGKQIVALQAAMERMGRDFPGAFGGYKLEVTESHQKTKADTSGTAKAMVGSFQQLGVEPFSHDQIQMLRDDASQAAFGVPPERVLHGSCLAHLHLDEP